MEEDKLKVNVCNNYIQFIPFFAYFWDNLYRKLSPCGDTFYD